MRCIKEWSAFAPRALSKAEQNYAQIEKECLSVLFACGRLTSTYLAESAHCSHRPQAFGPNFLEAIV